MNDARSFDFLCIYIFGQMFSLEELMGNVIFMYKNRTWILSRKNGSVTVSLPLSSLPPLPSLILILSPEAQVLIHRQVFFSISFPLFVVSFSIQVLIYLGDIRRSFYSFFLNHASYFQTHMTMLSFRTSFINNQYRDV